MRKAKIQILSFVLILGLAGGLFAGCGQKAEPQAAPNPQTAAEKTGSAGSTGAPATPGSGKITDKSITLTYWVGLNQNVGALFKTLSDTELYKEMERRTGIKIQFLHPPTGQGTEQFNLMIASSDLPDMIDHSWLSYPGGPEKAIDDGVIIRLNDLISKSSPNLKKILDSNKELDKQVKTDKGNYYVYPFIRGHENIMVFHGPIIRQDFLDELNLKMPVTMDDWYNVLKTFKEKKDMEAPLTFRQGASASDLATGNAFIGAYGVAKGFYQEDGKVKFGLIEPGYKDFLTTFRKWYSEKLIDQDFATNDSKAFDSRVTTDKSGAFIAYVGGGMGKYITLMKDKNPQFKLAGAPYPVLKAGETPKFGQRDNPYPGGNSVAITTKNKYPKESAMWLDYGYSQEGYMLYNFGIEGKSYKMDNGYPRYTEEITKNPNNLPMAQAMANYIRAFYGGPFVQAKEYFEQYTPNSEQIKAVETWAKADSSRKLPAITPTPEESQRFAAIMNEINTYTDEMLLKFIMGQEPIDKFDQYVAQVKKMGIDEALKLRQAALERYQKR